MEQGFGQFREAGTEDIQGALERVRLEFGLALPYLVNMQ